jgi:aldose sugar dehydrogenase
MERPPHWPVRRLTRLAPKETAMKTSLAIAAGLAALAGAPFACAQTAAPVEQGAKNVPGLEPAFPEQTRAPASDSGVTLAAEPLAEGLVNPWGVAVTPAGDMLVTERPGRLRVVRADGSLSDPVAGMPEVLAESQGGLLDVAVDPDFDENGLVYWTYAKPLGDGMSATAAARGRISPDLTEMSEVEDIFVQEPPSPSPMHYGSRLVFDEEGHVFVTTGEHFTEEERVNAQELSTTYGKIIRLDRDGAIPQDNPFVGEEGAIETIWSLGHRNIQAAALRGPGDLWTVEHGPQGGDELNKPQPGGNHGWPVVVYGQNYDGTPVGSGEADHEARGFVPPRYYWDPVIAPSGMVFYDGDLFPWAGDVLIGSLQPGALVRLELDGDTVTGEERLLTQQGRIRDVVQDRDGSLLVLTDADAGALLRLTPKGG